MNLPLNKILQGDCLEMLKTLPDNSIDCCVTSPPYYGLRDYGVDGQIGLEETPEMFVQKLMLVFNEVKRCLKPNGVLWFNMGDSYNGDKKGNTEIHKNKNAVTDSFEKKLWKGAKQKDLIGIPWMCAFALRANGWYLRQDIIWHKPNPMPESVTDRCTKAHEYIFLLSKSAKYYFDNEAIKTEASDSFKNDSRHITGSNDSHIKEGYLESKAQDPKGPHRMFNQHKNVQHNGQQNHSMNENRTNGEKDKYYEKANKRSVWTVTTKPFTGAHFATFPEDLIVDCIKAGCPENGVVIDPFFGAGTTGLVAGKLNRNYIGIELNPKYVDIAEQRLSNELGLFKRA